jgi:catechol 2,3-dioxygenase-like lactoylglutathione lyase family enzyme
MALDRIVTFLLTKNPEASLQFYRDTLGFKFLRDDGFALVFDANGTMLRISKMPEFTPAQSTVLGWQVKDIGATVGEFHAEGRGLRALPQYGAGPGRNRHFPNWRQGGVVQGSGWECPIVLSACFCLRIQAAR